MGATGGGAAEAEVERLLAKAEAAQESWEKVALLGQAAVATEERLGDLSRAERLWRRALHVDPEYERGWAQLERIYTAKHAWAQVAEVLQVRLDRSADVGEVIAMRLRLAGLYERNLGEPDRAIEALFAVCDLEPGNLAALDGLERLLGQAERWVELTRVLEARLDWETAPAELSAVAARLASVYEERLGDPEKARQVRERPR